MRFWPYQRNHFAARKIGGRECEAGQTEPNRGGRPGHNWREAAVVAVLLGGAALASALQPASPSAQSAEPSAQVQRADVIDDLIDAIEKMLGGGSSGSSGGSGSAGSSGTGGGSGSGGTP